MESKLTVGQITAIKSGETKAFLMTSYKACLSARSWVSQVAKSHPRSDVERYRCSINKDDNIVTITALKREVL